MKLYHFTSADHLPLILRDGFLKTVESNVSFKKEHAGPDVVWLTRKEESLAGDGLDNQHHDKRAIRFMVDLDKRSVHKWLEWAKAQGSSPRAIEAMIRAGGGGHNSWFVTSKSIPASQWIEVRRMHDGELVDFRNESA